jgi:hypothetical protein
MPPGTAKAWKMECYDFIEIFLSFVILCFNSMGKMEVGSCNQQHNFELALARALWQQIWQLLSDAVNHTTPGLNYLNPCLRIYSAECAKEFPWAYHVSKSPPPPAPSTYTSPSNVFSSIHLQSAGHSLHRNVGSDNLWLWLALEAGWCRS